MTEGDNPWTQAADADLAKRFFGLYDQYFGMTRSLWEALQAGGLPATPPSGPIPMPPLEMPALGPARELQEAWQRIGALAARVAEAQAKLSLQWGEVVQRALAAVAEQIRARAEAGEPLHGPKALHELWIDTAERAYADTAHGPDYVELQAELVNAASALRIEQRGMIERWAREFDLPTRAELDSVHLRLRELAAQLPRESERKRKRKSKR